MLRQRPQAAGDIFQTCPCRPPPLASVSSTNGEALSSFCRAMCAPRARLDLLPFDIVLESACRPQLLQSGYTGVLRTHCRSNNRQRSPLASRQALVFVLIQPLLQRFETTPSSPRVYPTCHLAARQPAFSASPSEQNQCLPFVRSI